MKGELTNSEEGPSTSAYLESALENYNPDESGDLRLSEDETRVFEQALAQAGFLAERLSDEALKALIEQVRQAIASGSAEQFLQSAPFMRDYDMSKLVEGTLARIVIFPRPVYVRSDLVAGAHSFGSWMGRGFRGRDEKTSERTGEKKSSLETIYDYASSPEPTLITSLLGGIDLVVTPDHQAILYSFANSHSTAAAKLRGEPLGVKSIRVHLPKPTTTS